MSLATGEGGMGLAGSAYNPKPTRESRAKRFM